MTPELALSQDEARRLATAAAEVQRHYTLPALDPGKVALATLVWTAGSIYWPKMRAAQVRKAAEKRRAAGIDDSAPVAQGGNVVPMVQPGGTPGVADWLG